MVFVEIRQRQLSGTMGLWPTIHQSPRFRQQVLLRLK